MVSPTKSADFIAAKQLFDLLTVIANEMDRQVPLTQVLTFLRVAAESSEGIDQAKLADEVGTSASNMSRSVRLLGEGTPGTGVEGMKLTSYDFDPTNQRRRIIRLTAKGTETMHRIADRFAKVKRT